ncbi:hypothetical protein [Halorarius halobius]|uniref:hypothetical protein n=1 Tax=Halorarius halobius TaxID=2962671 RepID=UPI0020CC49B7|nr:hypothetical protein [Halorarius halobius]
MVDDALVAITVVGVVAVAATGASVDSGRVTAREPVGCSASLVPVSQDGRVQSAPTVFEDIAGQVAVEDGDVRVRGVAAGVDEVLVAMLDRRGRVATEILDVGDDGVFEADVALTTARGTSLSKGSIAATVYSPGRDGVVGDGEVGGITRASLETLDETTRERIRRARANRTAKTREQIQDFMFEQTVNDSGSDDLALVDTFWFVDGRTSIETVGPVTANPTGVDTVHVGETLRVRGLTNRKPADTVVTVDAVDGATGRVVAFAATDTWEADGVWTVYLDTEGLEPGTYVLESDDGDDSDRVTVRLRPRDSRNGTARNASVTADIGETPRTGRLAPEPAVETGRC